MRMLLALFPFLLATAASANTSCEMKYDMHGWSAVYQTASGTGTVHCANGQSARVALTAKGGGATFGKMDVSGGDGKFSEVKDISEIFGTYARAEAAGGAVKAGEVQVLTKGEVSLSLAGSGRGWSIGVAVGELKIEHAAATHKKKK